MYLTEANVPLTVIDLESGARGDIIREATTMGQLWLCVRFWHLPLNTWLHVEEIMPDFGN
jgi:hypothetical protein